MRNILLFIILIYNASLFSQVKTLTDTFEGIGNISTWTEDNCSLNKGFINPYKTGINNSATVLKYSDNGGLYANIRFEAGTNFDLSSNSTFSLKIYVPSTGITGNQTNKIALKLQNSNLIEPWTTQCEIIKPIILDQWQIITFNFATETYVNLDANSNNPTNRFDFNRVLIQLNGENNTDKVIGYLDDFLYSYTNNSLKFDTLVWADEFDGNGSINYLNWFQQTQFPMGTSWFGNEQQHYTNRIDNSNVSNGTLKVVAKREAYKNQGITKQFTSARLNSKFAFKYGRVEVRARLSEGTGTLPAIWMLGKNINELGAYWQLNGYGSVTWPACGEIDIMEYWGSNVISSAVHHPINGNMSIDEYVANYQNKDGVTSDFHIYALEWDKDKITLSVDGINHLNYEPLIKNQYTWPFDAEQFILLNIAITPNITNAFVQSVMEVDYVRIYQQTSLGNSDVTKDNDLALFPNPANDKLNLVIPQNQIGNRAKIYSFLGQELNSYILNNDPTILDVSDYQNGIYLLKIETKSGIKTYKFIKK
jgi:beta-glucanase (GH16 family)